MKELAPLDKVMASSRRKFPSMKYSIMARNFFQGQKIERSFLWILEKYSRIWCIWQLRME